MSAPTDAWPEATEYCSLDAICPWCRAVQGDSWEYKLDDGEHVDTECDSCSKPIRVECIITVDFTTHPRLILEDPDAAHEEDPRIVGYPTAPGSSGASS